MTDNSEQSQIPQTSKDRSPSNVQRWTYWCRASHGHEPFAQSDGELVLWEDYERLTRENATLRSVCALWGLHEDPRHEDNVARTALSDEPSSAPPKRAYYETHEPPHCPTCACEARNGKPS